MAETLANVPIEGQIRTILHATLDDHAAEFDFLARPYLQLEQLVATFLELYGRHNDQINCLSELNQVFLSEVFNFLQKMRQKINTLTSIFSKLALTF